MTWHPWSSTFVVIVDQGFSIAVGSGEGLLWFKAPQRDRRKMAAQNEAAQNEAAELKMSPLAH